MRIVARRPLYWAVAVFAAASAAAAGVDVHLRRLAVQERREAAAELARGSAFAIEREFARSLSAASALAAMTGAGAPDRELDAVATRLLELDGATANLQLARDCTISHMWPAKGNEAAFGLDLLAHPVHRPFVRRVLETRRPLLYGPFELVQGGAGFALRVPVIVGTGPAARVWGLSSAIIRLHTLLEASRIPLLSDAGLEYEIFRAGAGGARDLLASSGRGPALAEPVQVSLDLPGERWTLGVAPRGGWSASTSPDVLHAAALLIALLAALLAYRVLSLPETLRREVAARTEELEEAHREQRRAEEAQRHSQKLEAVGLLAGGVAHDFNNLLVGILGYADVLAAEAAPGSVVEEAARTITSAAQRAADLTRRLLAFARLGSHRQVDVDVHAVVEEVTGLLGRTFDKAVRIEQRLHAPLRHVRGDPGHLQQVVMNLAMNAGDAMPSGGTLTLETTVEELDEAGATFGLAPGAYLVLSVTDTGVGIPRSQLDRIFEPFFTTKAEGRGTGLGLATVYGIVKAHGGAVRVYSEEGRGSRFMVYLPVRGEPAAVRPPEAAPLPRGSGVVLVVDDEEVVRQTAVRLLASLGYDPVAVAGGAEALRWIAARAVPPAAVVLDLAMPGMDGATCFRELRALVPDLPVVISSGFARNGRVQELLDAGAVEFVQKPYRAAELARALAAAVAPPAASRRSG